MKQTELQHFTASLKHAELTPNEYTMLVHGAIGRASYFDEQPSRHKRRLPHVTGFTNFLRSSLSDILADRQRISRIASTEPPLKP